MFSSQLIATVREALNEGCLILCFVLKQERQSMSTCQPLNLRNLRNQKSCLSTNFKRIFASQQFTISPYSAMPPMQDFRGKGTLAPSEWQKELQQTIAVSCLDEISQGPLLKADNILKKKMAKLYHSNRNIASSLGYANHILKGRHQFEYLYLGCP